MADDYDFIIIGSGGGAFVAALTAKNLGLKPLILEKRDKVGGTTAFSGGMIWVPNNPLMLRAGATDSLADARRYFDASVGPVDKSSTDAKRDAYLRAGPEMVRFLEEEGMKFVWADGYPDYHDDLPGGHKRGRSLCAQMFDVSQLGEWEDRLGRFGGYPPGSEFANTHEFAPLMVARKSWKGKATVLKVASRILKQAALGRKYRGSGVAVQGRLLKLVLDAGIEIRRETPVVDLTIMDGRVTGVIVEHGGRREAIRARRGVLVNIGGFARNRGVREQYQTKPVPRWTNANEADTGDLLAPLIAAGADLHNMHHSWYVLNSVCPDGSLPPGVHDGFMHHFDLAKPHVILVDGKGDRFANESGCYQCLGNRIHDKQIFPAYAIIESRHRDQFSWGTAMPGKTPQQWIDSGYMKKAGTIEELAAQIGIPPQQLRRTVDRFNGFARAGHDPDFHRGERAYDRHLGDPSVKPNPCLGTIEKGPFYACRVQPGDVGTNGGFVTDEHGRVLKTDGQWLGGLYATGNSTASVMRTSYPGAGITVGPSMIFGYLAATHAAQAAAAAPAEAPRTEAAVA